VARYGLDAPSLAVDDTVDGICCIMAVAQGNVRVARAMGVAAMEGGTLAFAVSAPLLLVHPAETPRGDVSDQYHPLYAPALTLAHGNRTAGSRHLEESASAPGEERAHDVEPRRSWPWSFKRGHDGAHQLLEPVRNPLEVVQQVIAPLDPVRRYGVVHGRRNDPEFLLAHPTILRSDSSTSHPIQRAAAVNDTLEAAGRGALAGARLEDRALLLRLGTGETDAPALASGPGFEAQVAGYRVLARGAPDDGDGVGRSSM